MLNNDFVCLFLSYLCLFCANVFILQSFHQTILAIIGLVVHAAQDLYRTQTPVGVVLIVFKFLCNLR